jgi:hypothetical protein
VYFHQEYILHIDAYKYIHIYIRVFACTEDITLSPFLSFFFFFFSLQSWRWNPGPWAGWVSALLLNYPPASQFFCHEIHITYHLPSYPSLSALFNGVKFTHHGYHQCYHHFQDSSSLKLGLCVRVFRSSALPLFLHLYYKCRVWLGVQTRGKAFE